MDRMEDDGCRNGATVDHAELVVAAKEDRGRREELVEAFLPLIANVARAYRRGGTIERDELMQEGVAGLLRALERYDPSLQTPFWAYACWWVRHAMQQLDSELSGSVVPSDREQREAERFAVCGRFGLDGEDRTLREVAGDLGLSGERARQIEQRALETLWQVVTWSAARHVTPDDRTPPFI